MVLLEVAVVVLMLAAGQFLLCPVPLTCLHSSYLSLFLEGVLKISDGALKTSSLSLLLAAISLINCWHAWILFNKLSYSF